jgi:pimeloyl-ACP methyl ester carboxylesterase
MDMKHCYLFSGLGVDERVFKYMDMQGYHVHFVTWIEPCKNEPVEAYVHRLLVQIATPKPVLIGLSFGGMMAVEVARYIEVEKVILISSAKTKHELPFYYRLAGSLNLHRLIPVGLLKQANAFSYWIFDIKGREQKQLLAAILKDTNPAFINWAINVIVKWKNRVKPARYLHIHGTADRILPAKYIDNYTPIENGGHFMVVDKAGEISRIIEQYIG